MSSYLALTIGPIVETLLGARATRELWGGSYLFSYLIRNIVRSLIVENIDDRDHPGKSKPNPNRIAGSVLLPSTKDIDTPNVLGAGLYPDRIIIRAVEGDEKKLKNAVESVLDDTAKKMAKQMEAKTFSETQLRDYLSRCLRLIQLPFEVGTDENVVLAATPYLDAAELCAPVIPIENTVDANGLNPLRLFLAKVNGSFLYEDAFHKELVAQDTLKRVAPQMADAHPRTRFLSMIEIATRELETIDPELYKTSIEDRITREITASPDVQKELDLEDDLVEVLRREFKDFKPRHLYVATVHADGDNMGKMVQRAGMAKDNGISEKSKLEAFSDVMLNFARSAAKIIAMHGGSPVYMGGDDMLFLAPITFRQKKDGDLLTIFDLIAQLELKFKVTIHKFASEVLQLDPSDLPTMTYGVALSYYKFPLYESKQASFNAMHHCKKNEKKNSINVDFRKHSGQKLDFMIQKKDDDFFEKVCEFVKVNIKDPRFLNGFTHKLETQKALLLSISSDEERVHHFFKNNFNEEYRHSEDFFNSLVSIVGILAKRSGGEMTEEDTRLLYTLLRFIHFIRSKDKAL